MTHKDAHRQPLGRRFRPTITSSLWYPSQINRSISIAVVKELLDIWRQDFGALMPLKQTDAPMPERPQRPSALLLSPLSFQPICTRYAYIRNCARFDENMKLCIVVREVKHSNIHKWQRYLRLFVQRQP